MKQSKFKNVIIVSEDCRPMAYSKSDHQLFLCDTTEWEDDVWPIQVYTREQARRYIRNTNRYRQRKGYPVERHKLMPVG